MQKKQKDTFDCRRPAWADSLYSFALYYSKNRDGKHLFIFRQATHSCNQYMSNHMDGFSHGRAPRYYHVHHERIQPALGYTQCRGKQDQGPQQDGGDVKSDHSSLPTLFRERDTYHQYAGTLDDRAHRPLHPSSTCRTAGSTAATSNRPYAETGHADDADVATERAVAAAQVTYGCGAAGLG